MAHFGEIRVHCLRKANQILIRHNNQVRNSLPVVEMSPVYPILLSLEVQSLVACSLLSYHHQSSSPANNTRERSKIHA